MTQCDDASDLGGRVARADFTTLERVGKLDRTPTNGIRVPARIGRTGVLRYQRADGTVVREYRPPTEAFRAESLASLEDAVVTVGHPKAAALVTPSIACSVSVGHVKSGGKRDGKFIAAELVVIDAQTIENIDQGLLVEISAGYTCRHDATPGTDPDTGEAYDVVQRQILYNHCALLGSGEGRAGADVSLRLDGVEVRLESGGAPDRAERTDSMEEIIDGKKYTVGTPDWAAARARRDARRDAEAEAMTTENAELKKKLADALTTQGVMQAAADAATATIAQLKKDLGEATSEETLDARTVARATLHEQARKVLGAETKLDGKSADAVRREVIVKLDGEKAVLGADGKPQSPAYVETYFGGRMAAFTASGSTSSVSPIVAARRDALGSPVPAGAKPPAVNPYDWSRG